MRRCARKLSLTALVLFLGARRRYGNAVALALAGTFLLATPAIAYARLAFAEPVSTLLILGACLLLWPLYPPTTLPADYRPGNRAILGAGLVIALQNSLATSQFPVTIVLGAIFMICVLIFRRGIVGEAYALLRRKT